MKKAMLSLFVLLFAANLFAQPVEKFSKVRIFVPDRSALERVWATGIDYEGVTGKIGGWMEFVAGDYELAQLAAQGISYSPVVEDLASYYQDRLTSQPVDALGFGYGTMGGFYTFAEVVQQLDTMAMLYPHLISARESVGVSIEGRKIWAVKISDHPDINETGEPEVLYTALHHAREPQGMMTLLYYMWWLLENRGVNPEATYLVNNRQMWFIPVMNPDGYVYNQTTNPSGGGMWRKNRRNNSGSYGVDLNRNYGPFYMWNASNGGSSTTPSSDTYRGTAPFSEPELQAIDAFMRARNIKTCLNYHTYGNYLIYPYGYLSRENGDSLLYRDWTYDMTFTGRYTNGTDQQTVNYSTRGNSDDYMYADTTKPRTYAMTPEVGTTGFWPSSSEIFPLAIENLLSNKQLAYFAGHYPRLREYRVLESQGGEEFSVQARIRNLGVAPAVNLNLALSASVPWVQLPSSVEIPNLMAQSETLLTVTGTVDGGAPLGSPIQLIITYSDPDGFYKIDTLRLFLGSPVVLFEDRASAGTGNWSTGQGWGLTSQAYSPPSAFTDSPSGNYAASAENSLTLLNNVSLVGYSSAQLRFWSKWTIEPSWDFATVEISTNSGSTWSYLRCEHSRPGSARSGSKQPAGSWGFDSYTPGLNWIEQSVNLTPYVGQQIKIRFRLAADGADQRDGFYLDDVRILGYSSAPPPAPPALVEPPNQATGQPTAITLRWRSTAGASSYRLQVATDSLFSTLVLNQGGILDTSKLVSGLSSGTEFYWRVRATGAAGTGPFTDFWSFVTQAGVTNVYTLVRSWNTVSLPLNVNDASVSTLLPGASSSVYRYVPNSGYQIVDTLRKGFGYWVKFDSAAQLSISGLPRQSDTLQLTAGWNLMGTLTEPIAVGSIVEAPPGLVISAYYGYDSAYVQVDTLIPAGGYWVKAGTNGMLILETGAERSASRSDTIQRGSNDARLPARRVTR